MFFPCNTDIHRFEEIHSQNIVEEEELEDFEQFIVAAIAGTNSGAGR